MEERERQTKFYGENKGGRGEGWERVGRERKRGRERGRERGMEGGVVTATTCSLVCNLDELLEYGAPPCQLLLSAYLCNHPGMNLHTIPYTINPA